MTETERTLAQRESQRRHAIRCYRALPPGFAIQGDLVEIPSPDDPDNAARAIKCAELVESYSQMIDPGDGSQIVALDRPASAEVRNMSGVAVVAAAKLDYDELIPPFSEGVLPVGNYAHTLVHAQETWADGHDPITDGDWTLVAETNNGNDFFYATGGALRPKLPAGLDRYATWRFDSANMAAVTADYSVEAICAGSAAGASRYFRIQLRQLNNDNRYTLHIHSDTDFEMYKIVGGVQTQLARTATKGQSALIRLEIVGSTLKGYWGGASEWTPVTDTDLAAAQYAGIRGINKNPAIGASYVSPFTVYVEDTPKCPVPGITSLETSLSVTLNSLINKDWAIAAPGAVSVPEGAELVAIVKVADLDDYTNVLEYVETLDPDHWPDLVIEVVRRIKAGS